MRERRFYLVTLGCPKNEVDSDLISTGLLEEGFREARCWDDAQIIIVNTCSFIRAAVEESLETVLDLASLKRNGSRLMVTGCLYQRYGDRLRELLPEVDAFFQPGEKVPIYPRYHKRHRGEGEDCIQESGWYEGEVSSKAGSRKAVRSAKAPRARRVFSGLQRGYVYLKIAEGCDRGCSFCTIPSIKGRLRSRDPQELVQEAEEAIRRGACELVLVSQDTVSYGRDKGMRDGLARLLEALTGIPGDFRLRVMYLQPDGLTGPLLEILGHPKVCSYLDIPFQHVDPQILRLMGRKGSAGEFSDLLQEARVRLEGVAVRTSFITGFPGEDRRSFRRLLDFLEEVRPDWLSVFPFSPEEGTRAAEMQPGCLRRTAEKRAEELREVQEEIMREKAASLRGATLKVLAEGPSEVAPGYYEGRSYREAPEVDGLIFIEAEAPFPCPSFREVCVTGSDGIDLLGRMEMERDGD